MTHLFISHASADKERARQLLDWLTARGLKNVFLDFDVKYGIRVGTSWERELYSQIEKCSAVALILTPNWFQSCWCFAEYTQARALGKAILPIVMHRIDEHTIAPDIQRVDLTQDPEAGYAKLGLALDSIVRSARAGLVYDPSRGPYPGLQPFEIEDAPVFFGRDGDILHIEERLNFRRTFGGPRIVGLFGAAGVGKSSLLSAGLIPRLRQDPTHWIVVPPVRSSPQLIDDLARAISRTLAQAQDWRAWRDRLLKGELRDELADLAYDLRTHTGASKACILLSFDQAEALLPSKRQNERAVELLRAIGSTQGDVMALVAARSDASDGLDASLGPVDKHHLAPIPISEVRTIVTAPARVAAIDIEEDLARVLVGDYVGAGSNLASLAFVLRELHERVRGSGRTLTRRGYDALGRMDGALEKHAEEVLRRFDGDPDVQVFEQAFRTRFMQVNDDGTFVLRPAAIPPGSPEIEHVFRRLVDARLLTPTHNEYGEAAYVLAHEHLIAKWPRLRHLIEQERERRTSLVRLEQQARAWETEGRPTSNLLTGRDLETARAVIEDRQDDLSQRLLQLYSQSSESVRRERRARNTRVVGGAFAAGFLLGIAWCFAYQHLANQRSAVENETMEQTINAPP